MQCKCKKLIPWSPPCGPRTIQTPCDKYEVIDLTKENEASKSSTEPMQMQMPNVMEKRQYVHGRQKLI